MSYLGVRTFTNYIVQKRKVGPLSSIAFQQADVLFAYKDSSYGDGCPNVEVDTIANPDNTTGYAVSNKPYEVITVGLRKRNPLLFDPIAAGVFSNAEIVDVTSEHVVEPNTHVIVLEGTFNASSNTTIDANLSIDVVYSETESTTLSGTGKVLQFKFALVPM